MTRQTLGHGPDSAAAGLDAGNTSRRAGTGPLAPPAATAASPRRYAYNGVDVYTLCRYVGLSIVAMSSGLNSGPLVRVMTLYRPAAGIAPRSEITPIRLNCVPSFCIAT